MAGHVALLLSECRHQGVVMVDGREGELIVTALADGTALAGWVVGVPGATGVAQGSDDAAFEYFKGLLLPRYDIDVDTAITAGLLIEIVIPKVGHRYNVACIDPGADKDDGQDFVFGTTAGRLEVQGADVVAFKPFKASGRVADTSLFAEMVYVGGS